MATAIIKPVIKDKTVKSKVYLYATSISGDYVSNHLNIGRRLKEDLHDAFGAGAHILVDANGKPYNGQTIGIDGEPPTVSDGHYRFEYHLKADRLCRVWYSSGAAQTIYDERVVKQVVDLATRRIGMAVSQMIGFKFPSFIDADLEVTVVTSDEQHATVVIEIQDKRSE
ncbi:MAG: hypothetical protein CVT67_02950 [Actinobacteria bacterium HGW-Actinobacteria-7]|jgi:hypothetical protein|nr:MAG: hypothetical protein CVT67_02950 [Actinobacteria bacterium HGW-Actinobacteria-7]